MPVPFALVRFHEAVTWLRRRVPMLKGEWEKLSDRARRRAFTVAGVTELEVVAQVMRACDKAVSDGETLEDFKRRVRTQLEEQWGRPDSARLETIFRTNVQTAYSSGRWHQLTKPAMLKAQPYGLLSAIMDGPKGTVCDTWRERRVIRPLADGWWETHWPPFHFRCRTTVIGLSERQAKALGGATRAPKVEADEGFGLAPVRAEWRPRLASIPAMLVQMFRRKYKG